MYLVTFDIWKVIKMSHWIIDLEEKLTAQYIMQRRKTIVIFIFAFFLFSLSFFFQIQFSFAQKVALKEVDIGEQLLRLTRQRFSIYYLYSIKSKV